MVFYLILAVASVVFTILCANIIVVIIIIIRYHKQGVSYVNLKNFVL